MTMTDFKITDPRGLLRTTRRDFVKGTAAIAAAAATGVAGIGTAYADDKGAQPAVLARPR